ncbi:MAG TPA: hypothetical protein DCQ14_02150 [Firmicutes bacterium]|nr:hypothetical protein [Bacillota bacterium]
MPERIQNTRKRPLRMPDWVQNFSRSHPSSTLNKFTAKKEGLQLNWFYWFIIALFVGRASLLREIMPFTLIFWAMVLRSPLPWKGAVTLGVLAGWLTLDAGVFPPWVLPATMLLWRLMDGGYTLYN